MSAMKKLNLLKGARFILPPVPEQRLELDDRDSQVFAAALADDQAEPNEALKAAVSSCVVTARREGDQLTVKVVGNPDPEAVRLAVRKALRSPDRREPLAGQMELFGEE